MKFLIILLFYLTLISCDISDKQPSVAIQKLIDIPDTTNNRYAKLFDYPDYLRKKEIAKQLYLADLESDKANSEVRIWFFGSNYNPQRVFIINSKDNLWTVTKLTYYMDFHEMKYPKVDSISTRQEAKKIISAQDFTLLNIEKLWRLPSQSEMRNGASFGCMDGYDLLIELNTKEKYKCLVYRCPDYHVSKDSTFQTVVSFKDKVVKLFNATNSSDK